MQLEGRHETLNLTEEGIALQVPIGADFIKSPGEHSTAQHPQHIKSHHALHCTARMAGTPMTFNPNAGNLPLRERTLNWLTTVCPSSTHEAH
jgi:hypothetical protein